MTNLLDAKIRHKYDGTPVLSKAEIERHACNYLVQYGKQVQIVDDFMNIYGVSHQAARIRLKVLGFMRYKIQ